MPKPAVVRVKRAFRGLVTNPAAEHVSPAHATDILNVHTADGSIRRRQGYDFINSTAVKALQFVDRFDRSNGDPNNNMASTDTLFVAGITNANPAVVTTTTSHGLATGFVVRFHSVVGMTEVNNRAYRITVLSTTTFELDGEDSTGFGTWSSSGRMLTCNSAPTGVDVTWGVLEMDGSSGKQYAPRIWNQTLRGHFDADNVSDVRLSGFVILNATGTATPLSGAHYAIEFLLRKYVGMAGSNDRSDGALDAVFTANQDAAVIDVEFLVEMRAKNLFGFNPGASAYTDDEAYTVKFTIPCGGVTAGARDDNYLWDDLKIETFKRTTGGMGSARQTSAGTDESPGVDEWIHVKIQVFGDATKTTIVVIVDGTTKITDEDESSPYTGAGFVKLLWRALDITDRRETLVRQVQIAGLVGYDTDSAGAASESALRINALARITQPDGDAFLLARAGEQLFVRNSAAFDFMRNTAPRLNRRSGLDDGTEAKLNYTQGDEFFTITDTNTDGKDLTNDYTFVAGDRLHLIAAIDTGGAEADTILTGLYEIDSKPSATTLKVKGIPLSPVATPTVDTIEVAYRILPKNSSDGVMGLVSDSTAGRGDSAQANAMTYFADGSDRLIKSDGEAAHLVGIKAPTKKPTITFVDFNSTLTKDTTYQYKFTFYNEVLGLESSASPASASITSTDPLASGEEGFRVEITGNQSDLMATHVRLYRSTDAGSTFVLSRTVPLPIDTYQQNWYVYDDLNDADLSSTNPPSVTANNIPPKATVLAYHADRMWYGGEKGALADPTKVFYSNLGTPDAVDPANLFRVGFGDGQPVTALVSGKALLLDTATAVLLVLKERSVYAILGNTASTFAVQKLFDVGCAGPLAQTVDEMGNLYFAGMDGIHRVSPALEITRLDFAIEDTYADDFKLSRLDKMAMVADKQDGLLLLSVTRSASSEQDRILVLPYRKPPVQDENGRLLFDWSIWDFEATCWALDPEPLGGSTLPGVHKLRFGASSGKVGTYRGEAGATEDDDGSGFTWKWTGPKLDLGTDRIKRWKHLSATFVKQATASNIKIGFLADDESSASTDTVAQASVDKYTRRVARRTKYLKPHFEAEADDVTAQILGYEISGQPTGWT